MAIALSEYNVYGNLVSSFGAGGVVMTKVGTNATANAVMVETGGKILVTGTAQENYLHADGSGYYQVELALVQYQSDGTLDPTFGSDGVALPFVTSGVTSDGYALTTLSNGNVAVAGQIEDSSSGHDIFVTEYSVATTPSSTYTYDVRNKMVGFSGATGTATYVYDDSGNRVRETTGGTTSFYLTDTANPTGYAQPIEVWTSTNGSLSSATLNTTYLIGDRVFGQDVGGTLSYLQVDGHSDTRLINNGTGTLINVLNYDAFGDALNFNASAPPTIFLYPDGPVDAVSGLRMPGDGTRDENITDDMFIEADPPGFSKNSDPASLHRYLYAEANPVNLSDPTGNYPWGEGPAPSGYGPTMDNQPVGGPPDLGPWKWSEDTMNSRGGTWTLPRRGGKSMSWDLDKGDWHGGPHWDYKNGTGVTTRWRNGVQIDDDDEEEIVGISTGDEIFAVGFGLALLLLAF